MKLATTILLVTFCAAARGDYPRLDISFQARGRVTVEAGPSVAAQVTVDFEESFERSRNRLALELLENGVRDKVLEDIEKRQAFRYDHKDRCEAIESRYDRVKSYLQAVKTASGHFLFPVRQLLTLEEKLLVNATAEVTTFLGTVADKWTFLLDEAKERLKVEAFWSAASTGKVEPLGFKITSYVKTELKEEWKEHSVQNVQINSFVHGDVDVRAFLQPRRGVFCERRREVISQVRDFVKGKVQKIHDKVKKVAQTFNSIGAVDTWFDQEKNEFRFNYAPERRQRVSRGVQRIVSHVQEVVYEFSEARKCAVKKARANPFDLESLFRDSDGQPDLEDFLALDKVEYTSLGETMEGDVSCDLYQGQRKDWPATETQGSITTVWEWCLANRVQSADFQFQVNGAPLVSLRVYITESPHTNTSKSLYYKGLRLAYNFYSLRNSTHQYLEDLSTDIKDCFAEANLKRLQFRAKIHDEVKKALLARHLKTQEHLAAWREAVSQAAKVKAGSLRVAELQLHLDEETKELEVSFTLLGRHPDLPAEVEEIPLEVAVDNVQATVDAGQVAVDVQLPADDQKNTPQEVSLKAEPGTLRAKREVIVAPDDNSSTFGGLSAGAVAAVAVAMLALGVAVGTVAIFLRKRNSQEYQKL